MEQFTFYEWYADILQSMDDISAGKLANCICAYEFEDREPMEQLSDKEDFYWSNIAGNFRLLLLCYKLPIFKFNGNNFFRKYAFIIRNKQNAVKRNFYCSLDTAKR